MSEVKEAYPADGLDAFYQLYGRAMDEWASVEWGVSLCFALATLMPIKLATAIFYSGQDFQTKRDLVHAALSETQLGVSEGQDIVDFIKAAVKMANQYSRARAMIANRRIMWNESSRKAELRGGDNWTSHDGERIDSAILDNIATNFEALHTIMVRTLSLTATKNIYSAEKGLMMLEELPTSALAKPTLRNL